MELIGVDEVEAILKVKTTKAYEIIKLLNKEQEEQGRLTVRGKTNEHYLRERYGLLDGWRELQ